MKVKIHQIAVALITVSLFAPASAGSFSESFKDWVLDSRAGPSTLEAEKVGLEGDSAKCMGCHDGTGAHRIVVKSAGSAMQFSLNGRQQNHPVGMNYDEYAASQTRSYRPRLQVNPGIRFENGQVTCVSCHRHKDHDRVVAALGGGVAAGVYRIDGEPASSGEQCSSSRALTVGPKVTDLCMSCHTI